MNIEFDIGQVWRFQNRQGEDNSTITILGVEKYDSDNTIIHIRIDAVKIHSSEAAGGYTNFIAHLPFSENALARSVTNFLGPIAALPDYSDGYNQWKEAFDTDRASYWKIDVAEVMDSIDNMMKEKK